MVDFRKQKLLAHTIPGVKQFDQTSCWAACLEWWAKATKINLPRAGQKEILADYPWNNDITSSNYGTITKVQLRRILNENKWNAATELVSAQKISHNYLRKKLEAGPTLIGFYSVFHRRAHANVLVAPSTNTQGQETGFIVMEPDNGTFKHHTYGFYTSDPGDLLLAWPSKNK